MAVLVLLSGPPIARAQDGCVGDVDQDGVVTVSDIAVVVAAVFDADNVSIPSPLDVNGDGSVTAADVVAVTALYGAPCGRPTATPTPRRTRTPTPLRTATVTPSRSATVTLPATPTRAVPPTATPTPACSVQPVGVGVTNGALAPTDCVRTIANAPRFTDVYAITGTPGAVLRVQVTGTSPLVPYLVVYDADGQFGSVEGAPPIDFVVSTTRPYQIAVTSSPSSLSLTGAYSLTISSVPCPTPVSIAFESSKRDSITLTDCPDPGSPSVGGAPDPADRFTFVVTDVPKNVRVKMQQLILDDDLFPLMTVLGPEGYEVVNQDLGVDCTGATSDLLCTEVHFLALQPGTYTVIATGGGGTGSYTLSLDSPRCTARALANIPADRPLTCAGSSSGCAGTLYGSSLRTPCAALLPAPGSVTDLPEPGSPADLYTFSAAAGDVISVGMVAGTGDAHLFLVGPGKTVVAENDSAAGAQLAATLVTPGTYTIVAANNTILAEDDTPIPYTLFVQKCPFRGTLNLGGPSTPGTFTSLDCVGAGDIPYRSYLLRGDAGQFVTTTMSSDRFDPVVRLYGTDGTVVENDNDPFEPTATTARVNRLLPVSGDYFVEVTGAPANPPDVVGNPPPSYAVRAKTCAVKATGVGSISGQWEDSDCEMGGRRVDVYSYTATGIGGAGAAIQVPPANGCVVGLLASGNQVPVAGCTGEALDTPVLAGQTQTLIIAPLEAATRGFYTASLARCATTALTFGDLRAEALTGADCPNAHGAPTDWFFVGGPIGLVQFNFGMSGLVTPSFPIAGVLTDLRGSVAFTGSFTGEPRAMYPNPANLGFLMTVTGAAPTDRGAYSISMDPAAYRQ